MLLHHSFSLEPSDATSVENNSDFAYKKVSNVTKIDSMRPLSYPPEYSRSV